jgi:hypothetical protein
MQQAVSLPFLLLQPHMLSPVPAPLLAAARFHPALAVVEDTHGLMWRGFRWSCSSWQVGPPQPSAASHVRTPQSSRLLVACDHARKGGDKQLRASCFVEGTYTYQPSLSHPPLEGLHALSLRAASCTTARCHLALDTLSWPNTCLARPRDVVNAPLEDFQAF